jgi:hypothetical protein
MEKERKTNQEHTRRGGGIAGPMAIDPREEARREEEVPPGPTAVGPREKMPSGPTAVGSWEKAPSGPAVVDLREEAGGEEARGLVRGGEANGVGRWRREAITAAAARGGGSTGRSGDGGSWRNFSSLPASSSSNRKFVQVPAACSIYREGISRGRWGVIRPYKLISRAGDVPTRPYMDL